MTDNRNQFLDAGDSDDDAGRNYDSEDDFQKGGRSAKRRKVDEDDSEAEDFSDQEDGEDGEGGLKQRDAPAEPAGAGDDDEGTEELPKGNKSGPTTELPGVSKPLTKKNLVATEAAIKKSGVVYLSRIPPFMKPAKLRSLLEPYGKINRIFLTPEDPAEHTRRVRNGGNKKRSFTEGWVEFVKKKDAKKACDLLNAQTIGGKKSSWYHDDVWAMKYLNGFKWWVSPRFLKHLQTWFDGRLTSVPGITSQNKSRLKMPNGPAECALKSPRPHARTKSLSAMSKEPKSSMGFSPRQQPNGRRQETTKKHQTAATWVPGLRTDRRRVKDGPSNKYPWQRRGNRKNSRSRSRGSSARSSDLSGGPGQGKGPCQLLLGSFGGFCSCAYTQLCFLFTLPSQALSPAFVLLRRQ
jgi:ESF2/ABP1 family protein